jgi:membrane protein implicated in regulation of membrane protease activity
MTVAELYFICFVVGFALSMLSFLLGDLHMHIHLPWHFHFGGAAHMNLGHVGHVGHGAHGGHGGQFAVINFGTITAFLAWFGGVGYLLTTHTSLMARVALGLALIAGFVGAAIVFLFVAKVLLRHEKEMDPADYEMVGVLGKVNSPIREGGTGELVFSRDGGRHVCGVRADLGEAIEKGTEVVVTGYEKGIAYVRRWEELEEGSERSEVRSEK